MESQDTQSQDTQSHARIHKHKTFHDRQQKSSHALLLCAVCHKGFGSNIKQDTHVHTTHKGYRYQCNLCEHVYDTFYGKNRHEHSHSKLKHVCNDCGAPFQFEYKLKLHEKIHSNTDLFECDKYDKSFTAHEMLVLHKKRHESTDTFLCDACEYKGNT